jgi:hypothetical protein
VKPVVTDEPCLEIEGGRHPVVESALKERAKASSPTIWTLAPTTDCG